VQACVTCDSVHADTEAPSLVAGVHLRVRQAPALVRPVP
jgi:hypothetical protein